MKYVLLLFLLISTIFDIRFKKVPAIGIWLCFWVMIIYRFYQLGKGNTTIGDFICSILPGILLYLFSRISNEVGNGDGLLIIATGCFFTWRTHLGMLLVAFLLAAAFAVCLIVVNKNFKNRRIPFLPFLFIASGLTLCL